MYTCCSAARGLAASPVASIRQTGRAPSRHNPPKVAGIVHLHTPVGSHAQGLRAAGIPFRGADSMDEIGGRVHQLRRVRAGVPQHGHHRGRFDLRHRPEKCTDVRGSLRQPPCVEVCPVTAASSRTPSTRSRRTSCRRSTQRCIDAPPQCPMERAWRGRHLPERSSVISSRSGPFASTSTTGPLPTASA